VLFVLFVSYEAGVGVSDGPPNDESPVIHEPETILGEQIEVSGVVVSLDPVQIDIGHADGSTGFVIENAPDVMFLGEFRQKGLSENLCYRRLKLCMKQFVRLGIDGSIQPILLVVELDHGLVNRNVTRTPSGFGL